MNDTQLKKILRLALIDEALEAFESLVSIDPDALYCCNGEECMCGGITNRARWQQIVDNMTEAHKEEET